MGEPTRRRFQFGLRSLVLLVLFIGLFCGYTVWWQRRIEGERLVADQLRRTFDAKVTAVARELEAARQEANKIALDREQRLAEQKEQFEERIKALSRELEIAVEARNVLALDRERIAAEADALRKRVKSP